MMKSFLVPFKKRKPTSLEEIVNGSVLLNALIFPDRKFGEID